MSVALPFVLPWLTFAITWTTAGLIVVLGTHLAQPALRRLEAAQRSTLLLALALLPLVVAALVAALGFLPKVGGVLVDPHCHAGTGCVPHIPVLHGTHSGAALLAAVIGTATGGLVWSIGDRLRRSLALATTLGALADRSEHEPFRVLESRERFAYCVGLFKPDVLVSRGVLDLPAAQRDAVLAHEHAHAARHDNLRHWLASVALWPVPRRWRATFLSRLTEAAEQAADLAAFTACGRAPLTDALAALGGSHKDLAGLGGCTDQVAERLHALDGSGRVALRPLLLVGLIAALCVLFALPALDVAHHGSELVLAWLG